MPIRPRRCKFTREATYHIPIVALTAHAMKTMIASDTPPAWTTVSTTLSTRARMQDCRALHLAWCLTVTWRSVSIADADKAPQCLPCSDFTT